MPRQIYSKVETTTKKKKKKGILRGIISRIQIINRAIVYEREGSIKAEKFPGK